MIPETGPLCGNPARLLMVRRHIELSVGKYLGRFLWQTFALMALGLIWLGNGVVIGRKIVSDPLVGAGCLSPYSNPIAYQWLYFLVAGFLISSILIFAFGFLSNAITRGGRGIYALLIFVSPLLGLVTEFVGSIPFYSIETSLIALAVYAVVTVPVAVFFVPGFIVHRRLFNRCNDR